MRTKYVRQGLGKIARLPVETRNVVNEGLRAGKRQVEILAELEALGFAGVSRANLSQWRKRGYQEWLEAQEGFEREHGLSAEAKALLGQLQPGGQMERADLGEALLGARLEELLESFKSTEGTEGKDEFLRVARVFTGFMLARAQRQRVEFERLKIRVPNAPDSGTECPPGQSADHHAGDSGENRCRRQTLLKNPHLIKRRCVRALFSKFVQSGSFAPPPSTLRRRCVGAPITKKKCAGEPAQGRSLC